VTRDCCCNFDNFSIITGNNQLWKYQLSSKSEHPVIRSEFFKPEEKRKKARQIIPTAPIQMFLNGFRRNSAVLSSTGPSTSILDGKTENGRLLFLFHEETLRYQTAFSSDAATVSASLAER
jgi:hypothetical protein